MKPMFFLPFLLSLPLFAAESLPVQSVMSDKDQEATGVNQMTDDQKKAFEKWAGDWTQKVVNQAPTYHQSSSLREWITHWPLADQPNTTATPKAISEQQKKLNKVIDKIRDSGKIIELKDGSVWRITDIDRKKTVTWNRGDKVDWAPSDSNYPPFYMTNLMENNINPTVNQVAGADMITPPSPTGVKTPEPASYYKDSVQISAIQVKGWDITMDNGAVWKIAPRDWAMVLRWQKGDRIRAEKVTDILYTYRLNNLDSGEQAQANPKK